MCNGPRSPGSQARADLWTLDLDSMLLKRVSGGPCRADLPVALAVDHSGHLYLEYQSEGINLYVLDVQSGQCTNSGVGAVSHGAGALAFSADDSPPPEALYFAGYYSSPPGDAGPGWGHRLGRSSFKKHPPSGIGARCGRRRSASARHVAGRLRRVTNVTGQPSSSVLRFEPDQHAWAHVADLNVGVQDVGLSICAPLR